MGASRVEDPRTFGAFEEAGRWDQNKEPTAFDQELHARVGSTHQPRRPRLLGLHGSLGIPRPPFSRLTPVVFPTHALPFSRLTPAFFPTHAVLFPDSRRPFSRLAPAFFPTHAFPFSRFTPLSAGSCARLTPRLTDIHTHIYIYVSYIYTYVYTCMRHGPLCLIRPFLLLAC